MTPDELASLIEQVAAAGDPAAFDALFAHFGPRLKGFLIGGGVRDDQAEELVQETMLMLWRRAETFDRRKASASTWLFTIARNKRIDAIRRTSKPDFDPHDPSLLPQAEAPVDDAVHARKRDAEVRAALAGLPDDQRDLLRRAFYGGKSHSQIADETGIPLGTVKSRIRLALRRLKDSVDGLEL